MLSNAHFAYKNRSVIVDYRRTLHADFVYEGLAEDEVLVEIYPYADDIAIVHAKLDKTWGKVDMALLLKQLDEKLDNEPEVQAYPEF